MDMVLKVSTQEGIYIVMRLNLQKPRETFITCTQPIAALQSSKSCVPAWAKSHRKTRWTLMEPSILGNLSQEAFVKDSTHSVSSQQLSLGKKNSMTSSSIYMNRHCPSSADNYPMLLAISREGRQGHSVSTAAAVP